MSKGINVIIGENGTGKTHLLKMIYFAYSDKEFKLEDKYVRKYEQKSIEIKGAFIEYESSRCYITEQGKHYKNSKEKEPIYIPVSEMLSHSKGFLALNSKYKMPFDATEVDIISNAELPETRKISKLNQKILKLLLTYIY